MGCYGRCGVYSKRPQFCRDYPQVHDFVPPGCTFHFIGEERRGSCQPEVCGQSICCAYPREGGEPEGRSLDAMAGGMPCRHLEWVETAPPKTASAEDHIESADQITSRLIASMIEDM